MVKKSPEEKQCVFTWYERAVDESVWGIEDGYKVPNTLVEMMKRYANDGLLNRDSQRLKLAKDVLNRFLSKENEYIEYLKKDVLELEQSVISDANSIRDPKSTFYIHTIEYDDLIRNINNGKYEINKIREIISQIKTTIDNLESNNIELKGVALNEKTSTY